MGDIADYQVDQYTSGRWGTKNNYKRRDFNYGSYKYRH